MTVGDNPAAFAKLDTLKFFSAMVLRSFIGSSFIPAPPFSYLKVNFHKHNTLIVKLKSIPLVDFVAGFLLLVYNKQ